jgi:hypothetical protein
MAKLTVVVQPERSRVRRKVRPRWTFLGPSTGRGSGSNHGREKPGQEPPSTAMRPARKSAP